MWASAFGYAPSARPWRLLNQECLDISREVRVDSSKKCKIIAPYKHLKRKDNFSALPEVEKRPRL